jgi:hypothetical protein
MIPLWKGKNLIYFEIIRSKVKVTVTINRIFDKAYKNERKLPWRFFFKTEIRSCKPFFMWQSESTNLSRTTLYTDLNCCTTVSDSKLEQKRWQDSFLLVLKACIYFLTIYFFMFQSKDTHLTECQFISLMILSNKMEFYKYPITDNTVHWSELLYYCIWQ